MIVDIGNELRLIKLFLFIFCGLSNLLCLYV